MFLFRPALRVFPVYLAVAVGIAFVLYKRSGTSLSFREWAFPARVYRHESNRVDAKLFVFGQMLELFGTFKLVVFTTAVAAATQNLLDPIAPTLFTVGPIVMTVAMVLAWDFTVYWVHRLHHEKGWLWPFHSVHHSAEIMTPVTVYRKHPIYDIFSRFSKGILGGIMQGLLLVFFTDSYALSTIAGVNAVYFVFNMVGSNFRHSHIWMSFGPVVEHVLVSPAQHQVHHSIELRHFNKNYGEVFAIWDWMFGTLYIATEQEPLEFGLSDRSGQRVEQPHPTFRAALSVPIADSWRALTGGSKTADPEPSEVAT